jgi:dihydroflavonol-4-reductase
MKVFITGGTGFIGKYTIELMVRRNYSLAVLVRKQNVPFAESKNISLIPGDINDKKALLKGMENCDAVVNLAGHYSFWEPDKSIFNTTNINGVRNVMECVLESGIKKIIHVSTVGIFGKPVDQPFNENSEPGPIRYSEYFKTKYEGDRIAWDLFDRKGLPLVVIYPVCVLGAGDTKASSKYIRDYINRKLPARVFRNGIFTFVCVKDISQAVVNALEKQGNIGERYIVGNYRCTWEEFSKLLTEVSGVPAPKLILPDPIVMMNAYILTGLANLTKRPPLWGMAVDQMKVMKAGFSADGSKTERELNIKYTPIRTALKEEIDFLRN